MIRRVIGLLLLCVLLCQAAQAEEEQAYIDILLYSKQDLLAQPFHCSGCTQQFERLVWDAQAEEGCFIPIEMTSLRVLDIDFMFVAADKKTAFWVDVERVSTLIEAINEGIPEEYRRRLVETVVIILSSEDYCLHYDYWTSRQRARLQVDALDTYFTSDRNLENVGGCCASFPGNSERERIIWLPTGKTIAKAGQASMQYNCAYSYHIAGDADILLAAKLIHEVTHALTLTRTMPPIDEYGFAANTAWELRQKVRGLDVPALQSVEALAYSQTLRVLKEQEPRALFSFYPYSEKVEELDESE